MKSSIVASITHFIKQSSVRHFHL